MDQEDLRSFRRYKTQAECEICINAETIKGRVLDYSDGIGVIIEKTPHLTKGAQADIKILDTDIAFKGEVAWIREVGEYLRVGFKRVDQLKGSLKDFKLSDLLIGIQRGTRTGILEISDGPIVKKIFIENGDMVFALSHNEDDRLGELLVKQGTITLEQYNQSSRLLTKTQQRLGKVLVDLGYLTPKELFSAVRYQIEEIILSLFILQDAGFEFFKGKLPTEEVITLQISAADIIYRGIKRIDSFVLLKQMFPSEEAVLTFSQDPLNIFQSLTIEESDKKILSYVNGMYSIKTILSLSPEKDFDTLRTICALIGTGIIREKREGEAPVDMSIDEILGKPEEEAPREFMEKIESVHDKIETQTYYEILGIRKDAPTEETRKAYYKLSRQFHPDRHFSYPSHDIKGKLVKILFYTTEAYETLSNSVKRHEYNRMLGLKARQAPMAEKPPMEEEPAVAGAYQSVDDTGDTGQVPEQRAESATAPVTSGEEQSVPEYDLDSQAQEGRGAEKDLAGSPETEEEEYQKETREQPESVGVPEEMIFMSQEAEGNVPVYDLDVDGYVETGEDSQIKVESYLEEPQTEQAAEKTEEKTEHVEEPVEMPEKIHAASEAGSAGMAAAGVSEGEETVPVYNLDTEGSGAGVEEAQEELSEALSGQERSEAEVTEPAEVIGDRGNEIASGTEELDVTAGTEERGEVEELKTEQSAETLPVYNLDVDGDFESDEEFPIDRESFLEELRKEAASEETEDKTEPVEEPAEMSEAIHTASEPDGEGIAAVEVPEGEETVPAYNMDTEGFGTGVEEAQEDLSETLPGLEHSKAEVTERAEDTVDTGPELVAGTEEPAVTAGAEERGQVEESTVQEVEETAPLYDLAAEDYGDTAEAGVEREKLYEEEQEESKIAAGADELTMVSERAVPEREEAPPFEHEAKVTKEKEEPRVSTLRKTFDKTEAASVKTRSKKAWVYGAVALIVALLGGGSYLFLPDKAGVFLRDLRQTVTQTGFLSSQQEQVVSKIQAQKAGQMEPLPSFRDEAFRELSRK
jgi:curved DNA-binding protein CbpA